MKREVVSCIFHIVNPSLYTEVGLSIPSPKNPDESYERYYPYIPILRMGLEPSILF